MLQIIMWITQLLSQVPQFVKDAELIHGPGTGATKKAAVIDGLSTLAKDVVGAGLVPAVAADAAIGAAGAVVDAVVAAFNAAGTFQSANK